jgi:ADP-heptose:LPS heptosyltransferase
MKIAIVQLGRIGDLILATTAIEMLKDRFPNAEIYFIASQSNFFVLNNNPDVTQVLVYNKNPAKFVAFLLKLKSIKFDIYIDPKDHFSDESRFLAVNANAKMKIGFNKKSENPQKRKHYTKKAFDIEIPGAEENTKLHFVERIRNAVKPLYNMALNSTLEKKTNEISEKNAALEDIFLKKNYKPKIYLDENSISSANKFLAENEIKQFHLLNISASKSERIFKENQWIEFIYSLKQQKSFNENLQNIVICSSLEDAAFAENIYQKTHLFLPEKRIFHFPPSNFATICALISAANLLISPDTSLVHVAASFDIPVISLTGNFPDNITKFYPLSSKNSVIFPKKENQIVQDIEVFQILNEYKNQFVE